MNITELAIYEKTGLIQDRFEYRKGKGNYVLISVITNKDLGVGDIIEFRNGDSIGVIRNISSKYLKERFDYVVSVIKDELKDLKSNPKFDIWYQTKNKKNIGRKRFEAGKILKIDKVKNENKSTKKEHAKLIKKYIGNPPQRTVELYDTIEAIEAIKGKNSLWPNERFRHDFKGSSKAAIYGLEDGSILIKSQTGKKLWKNFSGYKKGIDYK